MSVLIRRSDAIVIIQNADYKYPTWPHIVEAKEGMVQAIKSAHTIDALPVVRGNGCAVCNSLFAMRYETICDWSDDGKAVWDTNVMHFCPNCGARMDGEKHE